MASSTTAPSSVQQYTRATRHFASTRATEVLALQASPILGCALGGFSLERDGALRVVLLLLGSLALTAHVFVFNDWAGHGSDADDPQRAAVIHARRDVSRQQILHLALALLLVAIVALAVAGPAAILFGAAIAVLSLLYSCSPALGKRTPIVASFNHLLGGAAHFLLGYTAFHTPDTRGLATSLFFGLVFAGGHLNQEVRDHEGDRLSGIRTAAVAFGPRATFLASLATFTGAYALIATLATLGLLPSLLLWTTLLLWPIHLIFTLQALHRGLSYETARWMQRRYRLLFAAVGVAMLTSR
ncbi:MAG: UbiA family prenyltransferase [Chloroflexota bacterium]